jgi:uncharacterized protein (DUF427 family)
MVGALPLLTLQEQTMPKAVWDGAVIAEAPDDEVQVVEGNVYFPIRTVHPEYLQASDKTTQCPWKGTANYYHVVVNGEANRDAAWVYHAPREEAKQIAGHIAFWRGVEVRQ